MKLFHKKQQKEVEEKSELDIDVENRIKIHPKKVRKKLRMLYKEYKKGNLIFPEGFDKNKILNKE